MQPLKEEGLYLKANKCKFHQDEVKDMGQILGVNRMRMDAEKGQAATEWKAPGKLKRYKYS
jgi:hypothetical protein